MKVTTKKWNASEHLDNPKLIYEYLKASFAEGDSRLLMSAIANVAQAKGINETGRKSNIKHEHLYEDLSTNSSPKFDTVKQLIESFGYKLAIVQ